MKYFIISLMYFSIILLNLVIISATNKKQIAIIGAGVAGVSCAYFLNDLLGLKAELHIYEQNNRIGGRINSAIHGQNIFEAGATLFLSADKYTKNYSKQFKLSTKTILKSNEMLTIYRKRSKNPLLKYLPNLKEFMTGVNIGRFFGEVTYGFFKIYNTLEYYRFKTVKDLIKRMKIKNLNKMSALQWLKYFNVSEEGIKQNKACLIAAYGQFDRIPGLAASPALRKCLQFTFKIKNGNDRLAQSFYDNILEKPKLYLEERVVKLERIPGTTKSKIKSINKNDIEQERIFDMVIIATPLAPNLEPKIVFKGYRNPIKFEGKFHQKVIQIVEGNLKKDYVGSKYEPLIKVEDLIIYGEGENINHIVKIRKDVWRIQSNTKPDLDQMFDVGKKIITENVMVGYPDYANHVVGENEKFVLDDNLMYINCIEWAASSVEMSIIGAKNVARMIEICVEKNQPVTDNWFQC